MVPISCARVSLLLSTVLLLTKESFSLKSLVIKVPEAIKSGDTITMTCEYDLENVPLYSIKWYWNDEEFYRYIPKESPPFKAFTVKLVNVDLSKSGENAVTLRNIPRQLTGDYKCEVSADAPFFHTDILGAHMIVADLPNGEPVMHIRDSKIEIGKKVNVECTVPGSQPPPNITWLINNKEVRDNSDAITIYPTQSEESGSIEPKISRSKISILTNKPHFLQGVMTIRCYARIFDLWKGTAENLIRDDSPKLAQVLGSTLSQSQMDSIFEPGSSARWTANVSYIVVVFYSLLSGVLVAI